MRAQQDDRERRERAREKLVRYLAKLPEKSRDPRSANEALGWAQQCVKPHVERSDMVPGWDPDLRRLFDALAEAAPELLERRRSDFAEAAQHQIDFALALVGRGSWPSGVMAAVARDFLNSPPGTFAYEQKLPPEVLLEASLELLSREPVPLLQWSRIESLLPQATDEFRKLALLNYCGQDFRSRAFELCAGATADFAPTLLEALDDSRLSFTGAIAASLVVTQQLGSTWGTQIPACVRTGLLWDLRCGNDEEAGVSLRAYSSLASGVAAELLRECLGEERAIALVPALDDERVISELIDRVEAEAEFSPVVVDALAACGERATRALSEACAKKHPPTEVAVLTASVFGRLEAPDLATLVSLLGHSSKRVVTTAARSLELIGERARGALEEGAKAKKKAVRVQSDRLLSKLSDQHTDEVTPLTVVRERAQAMPAAQREAFMTLWLSAGDSEEDWQTQLKPELTRLGATALELLRNWFLQRLEDGETRLWCYAVEELRSDPEAVWVAVDTFARMPKLGASLWARPRRALGHCGELLCEPIVHALHTVHSEYREALFGLLAAQASTVEHGVFLTGLSDPSKTVRTHSVDGLSRVSDGPWVEVAKLLQATEVGTRVAAAELLAVWGRPEVSAEVARAWQTERSKQVRPYLEDTLVACGLAQLLFEQDATATPDSAPITEGAAERYLLSQTLPEKLPNFVHLTELPRLRFRSGADTPVEVRHGFLARLMQLDLTLKGRAIRYLLSAFDTGDVHAWSRWLYERWVQRRNSKYKWAVLQLSLLADDQLMDEAMSQLGDWKGHEHALVSCHLRAAQWHGSEVSVQWLGYWTENLASLGGRSSARQLFDRVAFKQGCSASELRRQLNPFLYDEREERLLSRECERGFPQQRLLSKLERSWLTGRQWPPDALVRLLSTQGFVQGERLWWRSVDGDVYRLCPDDEGRWQLQGLANQTTPNVESLRLLHPLDCSTQQLEQLQTQVSKPPRFKQIDRETFAPSQLAELSGIVVPNEQFSRWRREHHWFHGEPMDGGIVYTDSQHLLAHDLVVTLQHSGYGIGASEFDDDVRLLGLEFSDLDGTKLSASDLSPIVYSELHRSISLLSSRQS